MAGDRIRSCLKTTRANGGLRLPWEYTVSQDNELRAAFARLPPKAIYTTRDGLAGNTILRLFEDSRGDIWISTVGAAGYRAGSEQQRLFIDTPVKMACPPCRT